MAKLNARGASIEWRASKRVERPDSPDTAYTEMHYAKRSDGTLLKRQVVGVRPQYSWQGTRIERMDYGWKIANKNCPDYAIENLTKAGFDIQRVSL